ncbi:MAG: hypothetical protein NTV88_00555 [Candidatus Micrarchaeota archaeon]|nr:hypothetical protein [Candidatus Micrarchaeota archaeon]
MVQMRGQGATEYLVLLAVVLIIALVSIALLGFFPGLASDAKITQSQSYWKGASPFAITEYALSSTGTLKLRVLNNGPSVTGMTMVFSNATNGTSIPSFVQGEEKTIENSMPGWAKATGTSFEFNVTAYYNSTNSIAGVQAASKTIIGKVS